MFLGRRGGFEAPVQGFVLRGSCEVAGLHFEVIGRSGLQSFETEMLREISAGIDLEPIGDDRIEEIDVVVIAQSDAALCAGSGSL